ncbi:MAG TPA: FHA domain-containing protein [Bryobacteraceae bacterium]|nr:FHA domain-containing protein [Bryobacteraceae bacterium]
MPFFSEIEQAIENTFRRFTERAFGPSRSDDLVVIHRAILEQIAGKIQTAGRGRKIFPYPRVVVIFASSDAGRRALYRAAFGDKLEPALREVFQAAGCEVPRQFAVEVRTAETGPEPFAIEYLLDTSPATQAKPAAPAHLTVIRGKAHEPVYTLDKARINIGRLAELTDAEHRVIRRNDVVFEEGADEANATVSRKHAHIRREAGEYRICDDSSEFGTRIFRDGRALDVPAGNPRGERLRPGDEIYLGRACIRFEQ